jgi:endonuclease/exonuclease/phosphatase family metal-dependent hydrolase
MRLLLSIRKPLFVLQIFFFCSISCLGETFRVASYNVENYLDAPAHNRHAKSEEAKAKIRESILALKADVLGLQEIGSVSALQELRSSLKAAGMDFPYWEHVSGFDTNVHVAILSKFPFTALRPHTNDNYLLNGHRMRVSRGFAEADIQVNTNYSFTLILAHLKSKRPTAQEEESEMREQEARILREKIDSVLEKNPEVNLVVLGDLNDTRNSKSTKAIIGKGRNKLVDTRPAERNGDEPTAGGRAAEQHNVTWTHHYAVEDTYSRIDYILLSSGMAKEWMPSETYVLALPNWGVGSDHRPIVAAFESEEK